MACRPSDAANRRVISVYRPLGEAPYLDVDLFGRRERGLGEPDPLRAVLREAGPVVVVDAPVGGTAWVVTDPDLARSVLADPRVVKDPAHAPADRGPAAGLEPTAAEQPPHTALRRARAPLPTGRRVREHGDRIRAAVEVLREDFPHARLAVPFDELRQVGGGLQGYRLTALPVVLRPGTPRGRPVPDPGGLTWQG